MGEEKEYLALQWLFLPLLGGYIFYTRYSLLSFFASRCSAQRLIFNSGAVGLLLLIVARLVVLGDDWVHPYQARLIGLASNIVAAASAIVAIGLGWVFLDSRRVETLSQEFSKSPFKQRTGYFLGCVALTVGTLFFRLTTKHDLVTLLNIALTACILCIPVYALALLLAYWHRTLELHDRESGLFLRASMLTLMTAQLAFIWVVTADVQEKWWHQICPYDNSGTTFIACLLGAASWWPLNLLIRNGTAGAHLHTSRRTSALERFLYFAEVRASLVQVTLHDGKVYVGWVERIPPNPGAADSYLQILPSRSGFRDRRTKEIEFTTDYATLYKKLYEDLDDENECNAQIRRFMKVVPIADIRSANLYIEDKLPRLIIADRYRAR